MEKQRELKVVRTAQRQIDRTCILVAGMHRSGTSAVTRALNLLGFDVPENLLGVEEFNETGHWEPERIVAIHDEMLMMCDSRWDDWRPLDLNDLSSKQSREYAARLRGQLKTEFERLEGFVLKDPRICRFIPFYTEMLKSMGVETRFAIPFRNPVEVCDSLQLRDKMTRPYASLLWLRHIVDAEFYSRGYARSFFDYQELMDDHASVLRDAERDLSLLWPVPFERAREQLANHFVSKLKHHSADLDDVRASTEIGEWSKDAYNALRMLKLDPDDGAAMSKLDEIREAFDAAAVQVGTATLIEFNHREARFLQDRSELQADYDECHKKVESLVSENQLVHSEKDELRTHLERMARELAQVRDPQARTDNSLNNSELIHAIKEEISIRASEWQKYEELNGTIEALKIDFSEQKDRFEAALVAKDAELQHMLHQQGQDHASSISQLERMLDELKERHAEEVARVETMFEASQTEVAIGAERISEIEQNSHALKQEHAEEVQRLNEAIEDEQNKARLADEQASEAREKIAILQQDRTDLHRELGTLDAKTESMEGLLLAQRRDGDHLEAELRKSSARQQELFQQNEILKFDLDEMRELDAHKTAEFIAAEATILDARAAIDALELTGAELSEQLAKAQDVALHWEREYVEAQNAHSTDVLNLTQSRSWKITRPLRGMKRVLAEAGFARKLLRASIRSFFFTLPVPQSTKNRILRKYHNRRLKNSVLSKPKKPDQVMRSMPDTTLLASSDLESHSIQLQLPADGRWNIEYYNEKKAIIERYLAALSRPEDSGPLYTSDLSAANADDGPMVSLIVRTYANRWPLLKTALHSVLGQTYRNIEVVVIEDGGKTLERDVLELFADSAIKIKFVEQPKLGRSNSANAGLNCASGQLLGFLDDDDYLLSDHLAKLVGFAERRTDLMAVYSAALELSAELDPIKNVYTDVQENAVFMTAIPHSGELLNRNAFPIQSILFRREVCAPHDRFNTQLDALEDWLFWMRMLTGHRVGAIADITSVFYVPKSRSAHKRRMQAHLKAEPFFAVQRNAFYEERRLSDMEPINAHTCKIRDRALERAKFDPIEGERPRQALPHKPLYQVLETDHAPDITPRYPAKVAAYTSINLRYLPKALAWAKSVKAHNPDWETHILLNDAVPSEAHSWPDVDVVYPISKLGVPNFHSWAFSMRVVELCTATKPFYAKLLLNKGFEHVFYFDPDTHAYNDLNQLIDMFGDDDVLITPHCCEDASADAEIHFNEMSSLAHGLYNLGFLGLKQSENGHAVADFWSRRLLRHCADDHGRGLFTDQKWMNFVPIYFDGVKVLKHKGCNTASWNIANRPISVRDNEVFAADVPLIFFHFSGYDKNVPRAMFDVFGRFNAELESLISDYDRVNQRFERQFPVWQSEWALAKYENGSPIDDRHREIFRSQYQNQVVYAKPFYVSEDSFQTLMESLGEAGVSQLTAPPGFIRRYF